MHTPRRAFTLIEMMITITIVAVVAVMAVPRLGDNRHSKLFAASNVLTSDLELAQIMTISAPSRPVQVRIDPGTATYWLAYDSDSETPIAREQTGEPYIVTLGQGRAGGAAGVIIGLTGAPGNAVKFNASGGMADLTTKPRITLTLDGNWVKLDVATTTGSITETSGGGNEG